MSRALQNFVKTVVALVLDKRIFLIIFDYELVENKNNLVLEENK